MYVGKDFDPIDADETDVFSFDFSADLKNGRTLSVPLWNCTVIRTDPGATPDTNPQSRIDGAATITTAVRPITGATQTFVNQKVTGMIAGNLYALEATAQTSDGCLLSRYSKVYCTPIK